jgi:RNA polymerase sigma factor (sigma-70 family)
VSREIKSSVSEDREVIVGILNDSKSTLNQLYKTHFPMVLHLILSNNGNEDDAKDIFQESVIVLYNKVKSGEFELNSKLKTFIYSVCHRLWLKRLNQKSRNVSGDLLDLENLESIDQDLAYHEEKDAQFRQMEKALVLLGEPCKTIIEDYYMQNRSMQDISEKFGYTNADNAKTQKYKCLQRLKKLFFQV